MARLLGVLHARGRVIVIATLVGLTIGCAAYQAFTAPLGGDYPGPTCRTCDFAGPPIDALASGHIGRFFATQPVMGSVSLLLRTPVVAAVRPLGGGELLRYRLGSLVCLLAAAALAWALVALLRPRGRQWLLAATLLGLLFAGPLTERTLAWGHPEELLGALLCAVGVVLAMRGRVVAAGIALGLAIATKQWALLAVLPAVIACPGRRRQLLGVTGGVALLFILPMFLGDPSRFVTENLQVGAGLNAAHGSGVTPANIWFAYARVGGEVMGPSGTSSAYSIPASLAAVTHPLVFALGFGLPLLFWRRCTSRPHDELLLLLALVFLLRNVLDPLTYSYHLLPFFVAILSYETLRGRGVPIISLYSAATVWALGAVHDPTTLNRLYLAWTLPIAAYLAIRLFARHAPVRATDPGGISPRAATLMDQAT